MNKKIVMSMSVIVAAAAVIIGGTSAFFSDTETSTGNTFTAGAIDLQIDSTASYNGVSVAGSTWALKDLVPTADKFFNFADIKPGDYGENTISLHVINNDAYVCATVANLASNDNGINDPESSVDTTDGAGNGELDDTLLWKVWRDDGAGSGTAGDNIQNGSEQTLTEGYPVNGTLAVYDSTTGTGALAGGATGYLGVSWSLPLATGNEVQTDSLTGDISFNVVQSRNNGSFKCSDATTNVVHQSALETDNQNHLAAVTNGKWFFYNDTADQIMTIDQFNGTSGQNHMELVAGSEGAKMVLGTETNPRYNIATYKYKNVKLSDINILKYRVYDTTADSDKPYLHFNVDFLNNDTWQNRLVYIPTGLTTNTWTEVDTLQGGAGMWLYSGAFWPAGTTTVASTIAGTIARTWSSILADYPNAETRSTDSFLGVRVGEPGPAGATGVVDWIQFNSEKTDFQN